MITKYRITPLITSLALAACVATSAHAENYTLTDLGLLPNQKEGISSPAAINSQGQVAGTSGNSAFRYDVTKKEPMENLGTIPANSISRGLAISNDGQVVGDSSFGSDYTLLGGAQFIHAALFSEGSIADLGTIKQAGDFSRATGINVSNQVVGFVSSELESNATRAFVWTKSNGMVDLGTLGGDYARAFAINDSGFITGDSQPSDATIGATHAFLYQAYSLPGISHYPMRDLGTLGGQSSYGIAINADNHVVGYSEISNLDSRVHAFFHDGTKMVDLGSLGGTAFETDQSFATGVNKTDQVVGYTYLPSIATYTPRAAQISIIPSGPPTQVAFISTGGVMIDLNGSIGIEAKNYRLVSATAINDVGQITANAFNVSTNSFRAVLLTPMVPVPPFVSTVTINSADYDAKSHLFTVNANSTSKPSFGQSPVVRVFYAEGRVIGTLGQLKDGSFGGSFDLKSNPLTITVVNNSDASADAAVKEITDNGGGISAHRRIQAVRLPSKR